MAQDSAMFASQRIMSIHRPEWFQLTVPSSGTRYVRSTIRQAGYSAFKANGWHLAKAQDELNRGKPDLVWCHPSHAPADMIEWMAEHCKRSYIVIRDPIKTWATNWVDWEGRNRPDASKNKMAISHQIQIGPSWEYQNGFVKRWNPHIHRVEDPIVDFGKWAGFEVQEEGERYSTPSKMKQAVEEKDIDRIEYLCRGTGYWKWFVEEATPIFADLYEEQGYDLWWV